MNSDNKIITKANLSSRKIQIRKVIKTTAEQEQALRDQLHQEIENKTKACSNQSFDCSLPRIDGYEYCLRHILQDPKAPYKQCAFFYTSNGRRCLQPAPKHENKREHGLSNFCFEHSRLVQINKIRNAVGKYKECETTENFINNLSHHIKIDKTSTSKGDDVYEKEPEKMVVDPFVDIDCASVNDSKHKILDYASDSSTDEEPVTIGNSWKGCELDNSDNESIDSQSDDLLKHAGIYTTEEAAMITKEKLIKLQALYIEQFSRLQYVLKERRRKYLANLRKEREVNCSIYNQIKETPKERHMYEKLKALHQYHKRNGEEAILYKKYLEKRTRSATGLVNKAPHFPKCAYTEGGVKCMERTLPCCKFCKKHILEDKKQILFKACGVERSGVVCQDPITNIFENSTCFLHIELPAQRNYIQKKYESDTEDDDENIGHKTPKEENLDIKQEEIYTEEIIHTTKLPPHISTTEEIESTTLNSEENVLEEKPEGETEVKLIFSIQTNPYD